MAIPYPRIAEGIRVRVVQGALPQDPSLLGRMGTVIVASEYTSQSLGVVLDGENAPRYFTPEELEVRDQPALPPEREAAKLRRSLP